MKILFFNPHISLWAHTLPEAYLARSLKEKGYDISYLSCGEIQTYSAVISSWGISPNKSTKKDAINCANLNKKSIKAICKSYKFSQEMLDNFLTKDELIEINNIISKTIKEKSLDLEFFGINIGRLSLYELILHHKKMSIKLNSKQWKDYKIYLFNSLVILKSFSNYLAKERPDVIFTFSPQYSNLNPAMNYAKKKGIRVLFIESGNNLSDRLNNLRIWDWDKHNLVNPALKYWIKSEFNHVSEESAKGVVNHYKQLLTGKHFSVFSSSLKNLIDIRKKWRISSKQKIILMTLSSYDEAFAALIINAFPYKKVYSDVFKTQIDWIKETIKWVKSRKDLFLIIRVHPRDFPNKRDSIRSEQSYILRSNLINLPSNVKVNWPSENISFYEILEDTDVLLTGWSVTALEAMVLGIPVVTYDSQLPSYPKDIHYTGRSVNKYFKNIDKAILDGWNYKNVINGFRWLSYNFNFCTIKIAKDFGNYEQKKFSFFSNFLFRIKNKFIFLRNFIDLNKWEDNYLESNIVSVMLEKKIDAIPPAKKLIKRFKCEDNEKEIILKSLLELHKLIYKSRVLPKNKNGLSKNILEKVNQI